MAIPRIGCVPYLNGVPLVSWFQSPECDEAVKLEYAVPSQLARMLAHNEIDVAMVSIFELFRSPELHIVPAISIAADGPVKSVRLFSRVPFSEISSVALDSSSLTSVALTRILLDEVYDCHPRYVSHAPNLDEMLQRCDAALIIGDLKLFDTPARYILDLGDCWKRHTGLPFVYAAWLARPDGPLREVTCALTRARDWGCARLNELSLQASDRMRLPLPMVQDYFLNVMQYDLDTTKLAGMRAFEARCVAHGFVPSR